MSIGYAINTDINNLEKFYGNPKQQQPQEKAAQEAKVAFAPQEQRLSGVTLQKDEKGNVKMEVANDKCTLSHTNVSLRTAKPILVAALGQAKEKLDQFYKKFIAKLTEAYEEAVRGRFAYERLGARLAEKLIGIILQKMGANGPAQGKLEEIRTRVKSEMSIENYEKMCQTSYDEALSEVVC